MRDTALQNTHEFFEYVPDTVAAQIIGSTSATLRRWRHEGRGPRYVKVGSSVRYNVAWLQEFLADRVVETRDSTKPQEAA